MGIRLIKKLGYLPSTPKLAVLICRDRKDDTWLSARGRLGLRLAPVWNVLGADPHAK
jgi:hypothetical protein